MPRKAGAQATDALTEQRHPVSRLSANDLFLSATHQHDIDPSGSGETDARTKRPSESNKTSDANRAKVLFKCRHELSPILITQPDKIMHIDSRISAFATLISSSLNFLLPTRLFSLFLLDEPQPRKTTGEDHHDNQNGVLDHRNALRFI